VDLVNPLAAGPAGRTFPLAAGESAEHQIDVMSQCLVCWDLFVKSGDMAEEMALRRRDMVLEIDRMLVTAEIWSF